MVCWVFSSSTVCFKLPQSLSMCTNKHDCVNWGGQAIFILLAHDWASSLPTLYLEIRYMHVRPVGMDEIKSAAAMEGGGGGGGCTIVMESWKGTAYKQTDTHTTHTNLRTYTHTNRERGVFYTTWGGISLSLSLSPCSEEVYHVNFVRPTFRSETCKCWRLASCTFGSSLSEQQHCHYHPHLQSFSYFDPLPNQQFSKRTCVFARARESCFFKSAIPVMAVYKSWAACHTILAEALRSMPLTTCR